MNASPTDTAPEILTRDFVIVNQRGLHARASAKFVQIAESFDATVEVERDGIVVGGTSIMGLMMLAASPGCSIRITTCGPEAQQAMSALEELIAARFGEEA